MNEILRFKDNDTMVWKLRMFGFDAWYYCLKCIEDNASDVDSRLSFGARFCSNCGTKLDWENITQREKQKEVKK